MGKGWKPYKDSKGRWWMMDTLFRTKKQAQMYGVACRKAGDYYRIVKTEDGYEVWTSRKK